ncbi:lipoyl synthase [SAR202 cluster bacterium AC-409-J13_OGT_754m]|nr:lipoyl synthase [SAR202 cluster bacterium AC-409-J13_OGT_754m]
MSELNKNRLPAWLKVPMPGGKNYLELKKLMRSSALHTVCEEAMCPNIGDCWERRSATFMILGDICTRSCRYCAVTTGKPVGLDIGEPYRLARTVSEMRLKYCVITSVNRDDLADGGAFIFSQCIKRIRQLVPDCKVEVLIPDFQGSEVGINTVIEARPDVLNHNIESSKRIFRKVRPKGDYTRSLELLAYVKQVNPAIPTKSGIIVGMGEEWDEIIETMRDLRSVGCDLLTIGQYLRPSEKHLPISRFFKPSEFEMLKVIGMELGFKHVASGPLVRSSYHADEQLLATQGRV